MSNDRHEQSRAAFEAALKCENVERLEPGMRLYKHPFTQWRWEGWKMALDYAAEQQAAPTTRPAKPPLGAECPTCGVIPWHASKETEDEIRALSEPAPTPLTRPDRPGWWWMWIPGECMVSGKPRWIVTYFGQHDLPTFDAGTVWIPVTPPPAPSQTTNQNEQ